MKKKTKAKNSDTGMFVVIDGFSHPQLVTDPSDGRTLVFDTEHEALVEADNCQCGQVVELI